MSWAANGMPSILLGGRDCRSPEMPVKASFGSGRSNPSKPLVFAVGFGRMSCRICQASTEQVLDLGESPPANWLKSAPDEVQESFPLVLEWCSNCGNVQLRDALEPEVLYRDYVYVTPRSSMLQAHYDYLLSYLLADGYLSSESFVLEPGSNIGYFLEHIRNRVGRVLGVDPAERIAALANESGVPTISDFFNRSVAQQITREHGLADVVVARHCLAHNPSPHEMLDAASLALKDDGFLVIENAYVLNTIENTEFDQIYHEHMFYYSIRSMNTLLGLHGMRLVDVLMSLVHGGSIIFIAQKGLDGPTRSTVHAYEPRESQYLNREAFAAFASRTREVKDRLRELVDKLTGEGKSISTYGATAKGNTLLNYVGINASQIPFCVDSTTMKHGKILPGSNIEVISEDDARASPPDYYLLTAWNYQDEIVRKVRDSGNYRSRFIVPIPFVQIV
jgi:SAM-dependent methyltransferase